MHGIESDWIEDEMADDDEDFTNIVLEQKVKAAFAKAGWAKKLNFLEVFRWNDGPLHRSQPPVVVTFKSWLEGWKGISDHDFHFRKERKMLLNRPAQDWLKTGIALTEDSRCKSSFMNQPPIKSSCSHPSQFGHLTVCSLPGLDWLDQHQKPPSFSPSMSSSTTILIMMTMVTPVWVYLMSGLNSSDDTWEHNFETILRYLCETTTGTCTRKICLLGYPHSWCAYTFWGYPEETILRNCSLSTFPQSLPASLIISSMSVGECFIPIFCITCIQTNFNQALLTRKPPLLILQK